MLELDLELTAEQALDACRRHGLIVQNDFVTGQMGSDNVAGDAGDDEVFGGPADDTVNGGDGNDFVVGNLGSDTLLGGKGDDALMGDAFGPPGTAAFDVCNGQQGFDLSATCEQNNQMEGYLPPQV